MGKILDSESLIRSIKRRAMLPDDENTFTDSDYLEMINEEIELNMMHDLLTVHEEYLVYYDDISTEDGSTEYAIPYRSIGNKLRGAQIIDSAGNVYDLARISYEDLMDYNININNDFVFYVENDKLKFPGVIPFNNASLRLYYYLRPNLMVDNDRAGVITDIDRNTGVITLSNFPTDFVNLPLIDFIQAKTPNKIYSYDITLSSVNQSSKTITIDTDDIPSNLVVGDYINNAGETIVPQMPVELHPVIAQRVACLCLEALNDTEGLQNALRKLDNMQKSAWKLIDNRVETSPQKVVNRNSTLRQTQTRRWLGVRF